MSCPLPARKQPHVSSHCQSSTARVDMRCVPSTSVVNPVFVVNQFFLRSFSPKDEREEIMLILGKSKTLQIGSGKLDRWELIWFCVDLWLTLCSQLLSICSFFIFILSLLSFCSQLLSLCSQLLSLCSQILSLRSRLLSFIFSTFIFIFSTFISVLSIFIFLFSTYVFMLSICILVFILWTFNC